jgi:hypothetical protein
VKFCFGDSVLGPKLGPVCAGHVHYRHLSTPFSRNDGLIRGRCQAARNKC